MFLPVLQVVSCKEIYLNKNGTLSERCCIYAAIQIKNPQTRLNEQETTDVNKSSPKPHQNRSFRIR
jgi:hypothetical protein